jgi:hypothetical protein
MTTLLLASLLGLSPLRAEPLLTAEQAQALDAGVQEYKDGEKERACRRDVEALAATLSALSFTCTARCSTEKLWLGFAGASGATAQEAYDKTAAICERGRMHIVNKTVSCLNNYWAASFHEDLDADCPKRRATLEAELSTHRMTCKAVFGDESAFPLEATLSAANASSAYAAFAHVADQRGLAFKRFAPATDCAWRR